MEGNLSRARSSLYIHPALSSDGSTSAPSPPIVDSASSDPNTTSRFGHSRMPSDNLIHPDTDRSPPGARQQRSASALGAAGGYRQPLSNSKSADGLKLNPSKTPKRTSLPAPEKNLEGPSEDEMTHELRTGENRAHLDNYAGSTFGPSLERPTSRPGSASQMRELKDQVNGLKGRISSLREQARADSLKRRSLQSLRIPSPFTNAQVDKWHPEPPLSETKSGHEATNPKEEDINHAQEADQAPKDPDHSAPAPEEDESDYSEYEMASEGLQTPRASALVDGPVLDEAESAQMGPEDCVPPGDNIETIDDFDGDEDDFDYASESGESLYHDAPQTALSHEDREDAFDYEHFFLHSAMGTLSQEHLGRRGSYSSEGSVETTKGPILTSDERGGSRHHSRRGSGDTVSTMDSFATADEERAKRFSSTTTSSYHDASNGMEDEPSPSAEYEVDPHLRLASPGYEQYTNGISTRPRHNSVIHRPISNRASTLHRPSVSSFESTGTTRSFPLINGKVKMSGGILTPRGSPDEELRNVSDVLMNETASVAEKEGTKNRVMQGLGRDDEIMVQRLVASLGRCVLGLSDAGQASAEARVFRRRILEAKRVLEGLGSTA